MTEKNRIAAHRSERDADLPMGRALALLLLLLIGYSIDLIIGKPSHISNQYFPAVLCCALFTIGFFVIKKNPLMIWTPMPWFFITCALYFGIGPLIYPFGNVRTIAYLNAYYPLTDEELLRTNFLNTLGIFLVLFSYLVIKYSMNLRAARASRPLSASSLKAIAVTFLAIGLPVRYLLVLPYLFGLTNYVLPGSIMYLQALIPLSFIPLIILSKTSDKKWGIILWPVVLLETATATLEFSKTSILINIFVLIIAFYYTKPRLATIVVGFLLGGITYVTVTPVIPYGREEVLHNFASYNNQSTLIKRVEIVARYFSNIGISRGRSDGVQHSWERFNYANSQMFALTQYDEGKPGNSFKNIAYLFIPRMLWQDKPNISEVGKMFNYAIDGNPNSANAPGYFAEAYWNGGWGMVAGFCMVLGLIYYTFSAYAIKKMKSLELWYLPIIFMGMMMGLRPDGWIIQEIAGGIIMAIILHFLIRFIIAAITFRSGHQKIATGYQARGRIDAQTNTTIYRPAGMAPIRDKR